MTTHLQTDYLVVGAGAAGMAITDELLTHSDATVTLVDRRHAPGGHWLDAYPFVRLHQPSAFYGVSSARLGGDSLDEAGLNAGSYELAGRDEICAYYDRLMSRRFLPSGRVRFYPNCDYVGDHRFVSRLDGRSFEVDVQRRLVDATYTEGSIPATSPPPFEIEDGVRWVTPGDLVRVAWTPRRYVIVGAGKTALDTIVWLLERGIDASAVRWIKSREAWWMNRRYQQPFSLSPDYLHGIALQLEAMAECDTVEAILARLESLGVFFRIDEGVEATMLRGAVVSESELALLRRVEDVVRMGHVRRITHSEIALDQGTVPTDTDTLHVHCASAGLSKAPSRPIWEGGVLRVQPISWGYASYQYATLGVVEALVDDEDEKNRLCPPLGYWNVNTDYLRAFRAALVGGSVRRRHPALAPWIKATRLNPRNATLDYLDQPLAVDAQQRMGRVGGPAMASLARILDGA